MSAAPKAITQLARRAAFVGLDYRAARALFDSVYAADALILSGGNRSVAAENSGVRREWFQRMMSRGKAGESFRERCGDGET